MDMRAGAEACVEAALTEDTDARARDAGEDFMILGAAAESDATDAQKITAMKRIKPFRISNTLPKTRAKRRRRPDGLL
jgi:hypothetical protein